MMLEIFWHVITYVNVLFGMGFLLHRYGKLWLVTLPCTFMLFFIVFNVLGANFVVQQFNGPELRYLWSLNIAVFLHMLVFVVTDHVWGFSFREEASAYFAAPIESDSDTLPTRMVFVILVGIAVIVSLAYLIQLDSIPIFDLLKDGAKTLAQKREEATTEFEGKYHRYSFFFKYMLHFLTLMALASAWKKRSGFWWTILPPLLLFSMFMQVADLQKAPIIFFLISLLYTLFIIQGNVNLKRIFLFGVIALLLLYVMYLFIMGLLGQKTMLVVTAITGRLFKAQTKGILTTFRVFPAQLDYLLGTSFPNPAGIFPYERFPLEFLIFARTFPHSFIRGTSPTPYFIEYYANFGYGAMVASIVVVGFIMQTMQIILLRMRKTPFNIALYGFIMLHVASISITSMWKPIGVVFVSFLVIMYLLKIAIKSLESILPGKNEAEPDNR